MVLAVTDASDDTMWFPLLRDVLALEPMAIGEPDVVGGQAVIRIVISVTVCARTRTNG